jgi:cell division protein FtsB
MNGNKALIRKTVFLILAAAIASIFFNSIFDETGLMRGKRIQEQCILEEAEVTRLEQENLELRKEIIELRKSRSHRLEILGRTEFGMSRPGEVVFSFPVEHESVPE